MAEAMIRRELKPEDDKRIMAKYIDELSEVGK
jgi:hypothetical protein